MDDKLKQILNKANSQGASHDQLLSLTKTYYNSKSASVTPTAPVVKPTTTPTTPTTPKTSTKPTTTVFGDILFGKIDMSGDNRLKRDLKSNKEEIGSEEINVSKVPTLFEAYKNIYAKEINFNLNPNFDLENGLDINEINSWHKINSNLNKSAEERVKSWNTLLQNKNNLPYEGPGGLAEQITNFNKETYAKLLVDKNKLKDDYDKTIKNIKQESIDKKTELDELLFQYENFKLDPEEIKRLKYLRETFDENRYLDYEKTAKKEYQIKLKQNQDILNGLDAAVQNVKTPVVDKVINNPTAVLSEIKTDPKKYLLNITRDFELSQHMFQPELKDGIDYKYTKEFGGKKLIDDLNLETDINNNTPLFIKKEAFRKFLDVSLIDFQKNAYNALQKNKSIAKAMSKEYEKALNETIAYRDKSILDLKKEGKYELNPEWLKEINAQIESYKEKLNSEKLIVTEFDNVENKYFKDLKQWESYTATRDMDSKTFNIITDIAQPLYLASGAKIEGAWDVAESMSLAAADGLNLISKEERVARELGIYNKNKYDNLLYVPEYIKNTEAFKIHRGKDGSIKWTESFNKRAMFREGIKTTVESLLLYLSGGLIGEATGLEAILSKSEIGALRYFSDKIGIIPASIFEMNEIDQQEREAYLRGDYDSINKMFTGGLRKKVVEGATEMLWTPEANLFKGLEKQPIKQFALKQFFTQSLGKSLVNAELKPIIKILTENLLLVPAEESFEELAGNVINDPFEERQERRNLRFKATDELTKDKSIETVINTTIGMIPTMLWGVGKGSLGVKLNYFQDYNYELASYADQYQLYAIDAINKISEEKLLKIFPQYKSKEEIIEKTKKEYSNLRESFKEVAPFTRYLPESKEKDQLFNATLELKKLLSVIDPQATEEDLKEKEKKTTSLNLQIDALIQKANLNKKEIEERPTDYLHKNIDSFISTFNKDTISRDIIESILFKLNEFKSELEGNEKYVSSVEKINKQIEYYNTRLVELKNETDTIVNNLSTQTEEEEVVTEVKRPESVEESIAFMKLHPNEFSLNDIELYESGATKEETIIGKAQTYYDKLKETELQQKELKNQFEEKLSTLLEIKDPNKRLSSLRSYESELAGKKNGIELAKQLKPHIEETIKFIGENEVLEKTLKDVNGNIVLDANEKPIIKGNFIQVGESLKEVEDVSEDGKTIYFKTLDANNNFIEGEERDSIPINEAFLQFTKDEAHLKRTKLKIEKLTKELERLNNLSELTPEQEKSRKNVQAELEALLPKKEGEEEEEEDEEEEDEIPVTYEDGPVAYTPLRTIGVDMAKDLANYMANIVWKNTLIWLKNKSKSEGKKPYKDLGYYVSIVKGHLIPFSQQPDDTKAFILKKLNIKDESEIKPKEYEDLLKNTKVSVITNRKGEFLYFDKEGNPSTKSDARIATFRIPVMEKTKNNRGMYVYNKETGMEVPSQEQMNKNGITVESWNKQVEALNNLRNSDKDIQVLEINGISEGVPSIGKAVDTKISEVEKKTGELKITFTTKGIASVKINGISSKIVRPFISEDLIEVFMKIMVEDVLPEGMDKFQAIKGLIGNFIVIGQDTFDANGKLKYKDRITYDKKSDSFYYNGNQLSKEELKEKLSKTRLNILKNKYEQDSQIQIPTLVDGKIELGPFINYPKYVKDNVTIKFNEEAKKETLVSQYLTFGAPVDFEPESKKNPGRPKTNETKEEKVKNLQTEITNLTDEVSDLESKVVELENEIKDLKTKQEELSNKKRKTKKDKEDLNSTNNYISDKNDALTSIMLDLADKRGVIYSKSEELKALKETKPTTLVSDIERRKQEELNQLEKELNDLGIVIGENNLKESAEKLLEDIQSPFIKQVLKTLLNLISKTGTKLIITKGDINGMGVSYDHVTNTIQINLDTIINGFNRNSKLRASGGRDGFVLQTFDAGKGKATAISYLATQLLHETIHAFTTRQINSFEKNLKDELTKEEYEIIQKLQDIFNYIKNNKILKAEYGISDIHELLAELFSNETFADKLKNISLPKELQYKTKSKNLFEGIIDLISDLITKAIKGFTKQSINNEETAFQNISNLVSDLINAKYDEELDALKISQAEQTQTTETEVTQEEKELVAKIDDIIGELETSGKNSDIEDNVYGEKGKLVSEGFYILAGKLYKRVSNFLEKQINWSRNKPEQVTNLKNAVVVGNYIDLVARMFFENESVTFEQINDEIKNNPNQNKGFDNLNTKDSFNDLKNKLRAIKKQLIEKHGVGTKFYSGSMFLTFDTLGLYENKYTGIGGTMDLVVVSPKGKVHLYDFKNKITDVKENVLNKIHNSYEGKDSSAIDWTKQLSLYSEMFFQKTGIRIESISAIVFPTQYNKYSFSNKNEYNYTEIKGTEDEKNENFIKKVNEFSPKPSLKKDGKASLFSNEPIIYELGIDPREKPFTTNEAFNNLVIAKESKTTSNKSTKDTKKRRIVDPNALQKLKTIPNRATKRQAEEALEWFKNSPLSKFITLNRFMDIVNSESFAEWKAGVITLFEGSNDTDLYHEAWHEFSQLYLTIDQKLALYNELRKKEGTFVTYKGKVVAYKNASNIELEEVIAEDFRKYVLSGQTLILNGAPKRNSIFRSVYNFLKELITGRVDLQTYYERLYTGNIKKYKRDTRNQLFTKAYKTAEGVFRDNYVKLSYAQQNEFFDMFDSVLPAVIKEQNGSLASIVNNKKALDNAYNAMYNVFLDQLEKFKELLETEGKTKEQIEEDKIKFESYSDIFDDLDLITDDTFWDQLTKNYTKESKFLGLANVRFKEDVNTEELIDKFNTNDQESEESSLSNQKDSVFNRVGNEVSSKEVANKETIFLLATLPMYLNGEIVKVKHLPSFEYAQTIPFNTAWNTVSNKVQGVKNPVKIEKLIKELGEKQKGYLEILNRVIFSSPNPLSVNQLKGHISFIQDLSKPLVRMYEVVINPEGENGMTVRTIASSTTSVTNVKQEVNNNFQDNKDVDVLKYKEKGEDNIYYLNIPKVLEDFKNIGSGKALRARFLRVLGFEYSEETLKSQDYKDLLELDNELNDPLTYIYNMLENFQKLKDDTNPKTKNLNKDSFKNVDLSKPINLLTNKYFGKSPEGKKIVILGDEKSNINKLVDIELNNSFKFSVDNATGPKGSSVWQIQDWNYITQTYEDLNDAFTYPTYQDLIKEPHLSRFNLDTNPVMDNLYLNSMFILNVPKTDPEYGKRRKDKDGNYMTVKAINYAGLKVQLKGSQSEGLNTTGLTGFDKFLQDFNSLLFNGIMEHIRYGDKSSSYGTKFDKFLYSGSSLPINIEYFGKAFFKDDKYESLPIEFTRYIKNKIANEILAMRLAEENIGKNILNYKDKLENWQIFDGIEGFDTLLDKIKKSGMLTKEAYNNKEAILIALEQYSDEINTNLGRYFEKKYQDNLNMMDSVSTPIETKISSDLLKKYNKEQLIRAFTINNFILNVEHVALIAGDIRMYKSALDLYKRNSAYSAPKKLSVNNSLVNKTISFLYPKLFANRIKGVVPVDEDGRLKVAIFKDHVLSSKTNIMKVLEEKLGKNYPYLGKIRDIYDSMEEGDGQGWITLDAYRIFKVRQKDWSDAQEVVYNKMFNGEKISDEEMAYFQPIKAQYAGQTETEYLNVPGFHKFSLVPLIPEMIKGTSLEKINEQLLKQNIGYALFASGNKASATLNSKGEHNNFYVTNKKDPNKRTPNVETYHTQTIFYDYLGEQTKIDEKPKERVTFSTQLRKLLFSNLFNQGVPVDYKGKDWENATEEDKIKNSLTYRQSLKFKKTLQKLYDYYLQDLLNSLGAKYSEEKGFYEIDQARLVALLEKEFDRRDLPQNVHKILEIDEATGKFRYPLDSSIARNTIESVLISIVDNKLRKQKITGDALIQVASSGFEEAGFTSLKTSNDLPSYIHEGRTLPDGTKVTSAMKVKIAFNKAYRPLLNLNHTDGKPIGTVDRLNEVIKNEEWLDLGVNRKLLTLVGVRIPVQGLNSQEFMEVYQFLPELAGSVIIVPTEIVAKSGGDFDIDKLSIFRPNIVLDFDESNEESVKLRKEYLTQLREEKNLEEGLQDKSKIKDLQNKLEALKTKVILPLNIEKPTRTEEEIKAFYKEKIDKINKTIQKSWDIQSLKLEELFKSKNLSEKNIEELFDTSGDLKSTIKSLKDEIRELKNEIKSFEIGGEQEDKLISAIFKTDVNELIEQTISEINEEIEEKEKNIQFYYSQLEKVSEKIKILSIDKVRLKDLKEREEKRTIAQSKYTKQRKEVQKEKIQEISNSRNYLKSIENDLIDIIRESLERSDRFEELMTPNGTYLFNEFKEGKRTLTNTEMFSYKENLRQFLSNLVGKETLGIAAVHNTFYQLMQEAGMYLNNNYLPNPSNKNDKYPVRLFFNHNKTANGNISLSALTTVGSNVKISEIISQMINGYVDVAKDDWIFFVGLVKEVSSVALFMNHAGVPLNEIVAFVKNPIIKDYIKQKINSKSLFYKNATKDTIKNPTDYIRRTLFKKLGVPTNYVDKNLDVRELSIKKITKKVLEGFKGTNILDNDQKEITENKKQAQILAHFIELEELSSNLTELMGSLNADTNKAKSIYFAEETFRKLRSVKLKNLFPLDKINSIENNSSISSFVNIKDGVKRIITDLWKQVFTVGDARTLNTFLYNKLTDDFNIKGDLRGKNKEKFLKTFKNDLFQYIFQNYVFKPNSTQLISKSIKPLLDNKSNKSIRVLITDFRNKFPDIAKTNSLIEKLTYSISNNKEAGTNLVNPKLNTGKLDVSMSNELTEAFEKLLNDTNPEVVQFAKILAYIGFMQSGLNKSNISYTTIIPNEAYSPLMKDPILKFGEYLQKEESLKTLENFYKLFRRNNPNFFTIEQSFPNKEPYRFKDYEDLNKFDIFADMSNLAAAPIVKPKEEIVTAVPVSNNPKDFVNHSGGAYGGDTFWDLIGREFGVTNHKHYKDAGNANLSQQLKNKGVKAEILTEEQMNFARQKVKELLGIDYSIKPSDTEKQILQKNLQVRNFYQVYNADAVYAIAKINNDNKSVSGGTNTAIQLGIKLNKPVYVWDINSETWNKFETNLEDDISGKTVSEFYEVETPTLTQNFAGIGSRDIENYNVQVEGKWQPREEYVGKDKEEKAKQAIRDVYKNTFKATQPPITEVVPTVSTAPITAEQIYSQLGTQTKTPNIVISNIKTKDGKYDRGANIKEAEVNKRIYSMETDSDLNFSNPWAHFDRKGTIKTKTTKEAVENYIAWLTTDKFKDVKPERRKWILDILKSGQLKGKPIQYYAELKEPSHATALDYLINQYDWSKPTQPSTQPTINVVVKPGPTTSKGMSFNLGKGITAVWNKETSMFDFYGQKNKLIEDFKKYEPYIYKLPNIKGLLKTWFNDLLTPEQQNEIRVDVRDYYVASMNGGEYVKEDLETFLIKSLKDIKFKSKSLEKDVTDVDKTKWFSENGITPDTWISDELLNPENPEGLIQLGLALGEDEQSILDTIKNIIERYPKGISSKDIKEVLNMQIPINKELNNNFMIKYGVSLKDIISNLQKELDISNENNIPDSSNTSDDINKTDDWKKEDNNDNCEAPF